MYQPSTPKDNEATEMMPDAESGPGEPMMPAGHSLPGHAHPMKPEPGGHHAKLAAHFHQQDMPKKGRR